MVVKLVMNHPIGSQAVSKIAVNNKTKSKVILPQAVAEFFPAGFSC